MKQRNDALLYIHNWSTEAAKHYIIGSSTATLSVAIGVTTDKLCSANIIGGSGSITVSELSATRAKGTFSVVARNIDGATISITDGMFDVTL